MDILHYAQRCGQTRKNVSGIGRVLYLSLSDSKNQQTESAMEIISTLEKEINDAKARNREARKRYYEQNKDKILARHKDWREKNQDYMKTYRSKNREKILERNKLYYQNNKEKVDAIKDTWRKQNSDKVKQYRRQYRQNIKTKQKEVVNAQFNH